MVYCRMRTHSLCGHRHPRGLSPPLDLPPDRGETTRLVLPLKRGRYGGGVLGVGACESSVIPFDPKPPLASLPSRGGDIQIVRLFQVLNSNIIEMRLLRDYINRNGY